MLERDINKLIDSEYNRWQRAVGDYKSFQSPKTYEAVTKATNRYNELCRAYRTWMKTGEWIF